jgi:hypothetical protein
VLIELQVLIGLVATPLRRGYYSKGQKGKRIEQEIGIYP